MVREEARKAKHRDLQQEAVAIPKDRGRKHRASGPGREELGRFQRWRNGGGVRKGIPRPGNSTVKDQEGRGWGPALDEVGYGSLGWMYTICGVQSQRDQMFPC